VRIVVFGAGYFGKRYISELSHNLVAVVEPNEATAKEVRDKFNVSVYPSLPDDLDYDGAVIATPPEYHVRLAEAVLKAGRYALVEKPLATSTEEALCLLPYRKRVMSAHIYLYHPMVDQLKQMSCNAMIDHVFCRRTNDGPVRSWADAMYDLMPHDISVLNYMFGMPIYASSSGHRNWACSHIEYPGVDAIVYVSWIGGPKIRTIELAFANKPDRFIFDDTKVVLEVTPLRRMLDAFLSTQWDRCTLEEGMNVMKVLDMCSLLN
jgi:predicted dehydrogenase